jgi:hypothetical protein
LANLFLLVRHITGCMYCLQIQELLLASLLEMEFLHRQEELEHLELERALTLSVAVEEERLRQLMAEAKRADGDEDGEADTRGRPAALHSEAKVRRRSCNSGCRVSCY